MREKLKNLIDVKSIITIMLAGVFSFLSIRGTIQPDQFLTIFTVIISFYFGVQYQKKTDTQEDTK